MSADEQKQPHGPRPSERVYRPKRFRPPPVRTRTAPIVQRSRLAFEQEVDGQREALAQALVPGPAPRPALVFEQEETASPARAVPELSAAAAETQRLLDLAAGREGTSDGDAQDARDGKRVAAPKHPGHPFHAVNASAVEPGAVPAPPKRATSRLNWISVFLSEKVAGRRRRRRASSMMLRRSGILFAVAERFAGGWWRRVRRAVGAIDGVTRRARLPLAGIVTGLALAALTLVLCAQAEWRSEHSAVAVASVFAASLVLTVAGQPARNLLGFAGIMIIATTLAEVVRQHERVFEVLMNLLG
ncbi:MAG: hypothetical protein ACYSU0_08690 [Planctomycetota bacterium]